MAGDPTFQDALDALNATRERLHLEESMPEITADNIADIGVLPADQLNTFMGMFNLVLQERYFRVMFDAKDNPFRAFMIDMREDGFGIRDVMQNIIDGQTPMWNESDANIATDLVAYAGDNFEQKYHTKKFERQFKTSINRREYKKVFTAYGIVQYMQNKIANLNSSAEYWLMTTVLDEIKSHAEASKFVMVNGLNLNTAQGIKDGIEKVKTVMTGALQPTRAYNKDGILTKAQDSSFLYLITTPEKLERITTQVLAGTFNMPLLDLSKYKVLLAPVGYDLGTVTVDDGGGESHTEDVQFIVIDRLAFPVGIKTWEMRTFPVPNTLWDNNWLSIEGIIGIDTFMTGVAFTGSYGNFTQPVEPATSVRVPLYSIKESFVTTVKDSDNNSIALVEIGEDALYVGSIDVGGTFTHAPTRRGYTASIQVARKDGTVYEAQSSAGGEFSYTVTENDTAIYFYDDET